MFPLGWIYIDCADPVQPLTKAGEELDYIDHDLSEELDDLDCDLSDLSDADDLDCDVSDLSDVRKVVVLILECRPLLLRHRYVHLGQFIATENILHWCSSKYLCHQKGGLGLRSRCGDKTLGMRLRYTFLCSTVHYYCEIVLMTHLGQRSRFGDASLGIRRRYTRNVSVQCTTTVKGLY